MSSEQPPHIHTEETRTLDDPAAVAGNDPGDMRGQIESFEGRLLEGLELEPDPEPAIKPMSRIVLCGMGGSAVAGDLIRAALGSRFNRPFEVSRGYGLPAGCGAETLAFFCSYSGNTEETLSAYSTGRKRAVWSVCVTSGGELARRALSDQVPRIMVPAGHPPRASFGFAFSAILNILAVLGVAPDVQAEIRQSAESLSRLQQRYRVDSSTSSNPAKQLALELAQTVPVLYGTEGRLKLVASRWAAQIAENGKQLAYASELPEMNHNEIVGWRHPAGALSRLRPVFLIDSGDHPANLRRTTITSSLMQRQGLETSIVETQGGTWMERLLGIILLGDWVSYYLAFLNREDPTPVAAIDLLKRELEQS